MKVLIITDGFFPGKNYGGPPVSVDNFCSLMNQYECYIITKNHDKDDKTPYSNICSGWNDRGNCKVYYLSDSEFTFQRFDSLIEEVCPDWIFLQSLFQRCVIPCLTISRKRDIKILLAPRGELCKGAFRKKYKKLPYITVLHLFGLLRNAYFMATSMEEKEAIQRYLCRGADARIFLVSNIPSIPVVAYTPHRTEGDTTRFIFLSRIHPKKNLLFAIQCLNQVQGKICFDIYGPMEDATYWNTCQKACEQLPDGIKVEYKGVVSHEDIHGIFSQYDGFLFPTLSENYGHVIAESLIAGCPVVASDQTPWTDLEEYGAGWAIALSDKAKFVASIQSIVNNKDTTYSCSAIDYAGLKLNLRELKEQYSAILEICRFR